MGLGPSTPTWTYTPSELAGTYLSRLPHDVLESLKMYTRDIWWYNEKAKLKLKSSLSLNQTSFGFDSDDQLLILKKSTIWRLSLVDGGQAQVTELSGKPHLHQMVVCGNYAILYNFSCLQVLKPNGKMFPKRPISFMKLQSVHETPLQNTVLVKQERSLVLLNYVNGDQIPVVLPHRLRELVSWKWGAYGGYANCLGIASHRRVFIVNGETGLTIRSEKFANPPFIHHLARGDREGDFIAVTAWIVGWMRDGFPCEMARFCRPVLVYGFFEIPQNVESPYRFSSMDLVQRDNPVHFDEIFHSSSKIIQVLATDNGRPRIYGVNSSEFYFIPELRTNLRNPCTGEVRGNIAFWSNGRDQISILQLYPMKLLQSIIVPKYVQKIEKVFARGPRLIVHIRDRKNNPEFLLYNLLEHSK